LFVAGVREQTLNAMLALAILQCVSGSIGSALAFRHFVKRTGHTPRVRLVALAVLGLLVGVGPGLLLLAFGSFVAFGSAHGRPLRVQGRLIYSKLRKGSSWSRGMRPNIGDLDVATKRALEVLWLHDAQKEHASVPAFSRISWILAAVGAPADLVEWAHRAALEEIDHTRRCFALAAGYAGQTHTVEPMPDLLAGGFDLKGNPLLILAKESLEDGCLLEDFNADVAGACAHICKDEGVRDVLERIAREERSHADFSWALLRWVLQQKDTYISNHIAHAVYKLSLLRRPTAVSAEQQFLVTQANAQQLRAHGRLDDAEWAILWRERLNITKTRALNMLTELGIDLPRKRRRSDFQPQLPHEYDVTGYDVTG